MFNCYFFFLSSSFRAPPPLQGWGSRPPFQTLHGLQCASFSAIVRRVASPSFWNPDVLVPIFRLSQIDLNFWYSIRVWHRWTLVPARVGIEFKPFCDHGRKVTTNQAPNTAPLSCFWHFLCSLVPRPEAETGPSRDEISWNLATRLPGNSVLYQ